MGGNVGLFSNQKPLRTTKHELGFSGGASHLDVGEVLGDGVGLQQSGQQGGSHSSYEANHGATT
jgi:hypothetical protein